MPWLEASNVGSSLLSIVESQVDRIRILDLGARFVEGNPARYAHLLGHDKVECAMVDADQKACTRLAEKFSRYCRVIEVAVADGDNHMLHLCKMRSRSSLFAPNLSLCEEFQAFAEGSEVEETKPVRSVRLDEIPGLEDCDFVKLDLQGAECMALQGGRKCLASVLAVEVEVEFVEQYIGQPLFGDIDCVAREFGWMFHTFLGYGTRTLKPMVINGSPTNGINQWLWADAVYVLPLSRLAELEQERLLRMAVLMHDLYGSWDLAYRCLSLYDARANTDFKGQYLELIRSSDAGD